MPATFTFHAQTEDDTERLGRALAEAVPHGVIALDGPLGAGKTRLVQAVAAASGVDRREVVSPTFVLVHEYHGSRPIYHLDAYRLSGEDDFFHLGGWEMLGEDGVSVIEWAERISAALPADRIEVSIDILGPDSRELRLLGYGSGAGRVEAVA